MVLGFRHHHAIDQDAGDFDLTRVQGAALGQPLDLDDHHPAGIARRHGQGQHFQGQRLALHGDVALGVRGGAAHDGHVDR